MSRAFVKESDEELSAGELPERPISDAPNYVTPRGMAQLQARLRELQQEHAQLVSADETMAKQRRAEVERDLRYYNAQIERAVVVNPQAQPHDEVRFGATVTIRDENDVAHVFHIVGDDEADVVAGHISWASPLAKALIGARIGDVVVWQRPAGRTEVEVKNIQYIVRS